MTLLPAGYWPTTYWSENYWMQQYWPVSPQPTGPVAVQVWRGPSAPVGFVEAHPFLVYWLKVWLEMKVERNSKYA